MPRASNGANAISSPTGCPHRPVASAPPFPARRSLGRRRLRDGPPAPEGLRQQHGGAESAPQNIDLISLVRERDSLRGDDLEVVVHPPSVAIREQLERFLGRLYRPPLLLGLLLEDAERRQVVLHLLERGQGGLPVGRDRRVVGGAGRLGGRAP